MRVFSALFPPDEVVEDFSRVVAPLKRHYSELEWTSPLLWHMTLTYFGNLSIDETGRLAHAMDKFTSQRAPFQVRIDGAGATPNLVEGETLFAKLDAPDNALLDLYLGGITAVQTFGWVLDRRKFRPHFPLARCARPSNLTELVQLVSEYRSQPWEVGSVAIVWARPGDDGRPYFDLLGEHAFTGETPVAVPQRPEPPAAPPVAPLLAARLAPVVPLVQPEPPAATPAPPARPLREVPSEPCIPDTVDW